MQPIEMTAKEVKDKFGAPLFFPNSKQWKAARTK